MSQQSSRVGHRGEHGHEHLRRNLGNRHIQLIANGGAIGTGLFMDSGKTISLAGPSIVFVYTVIGVALLALTVGYWLRQVARVRAPAGRHRFRRCSWRR